MFGSLLALSYVGYNQAAMLDFYFFFFLKNIKNVLEWFGETVYNQTVEMQYDNSFQIEMLNAQMIMNLNSLSRFFPFFENYSQSKSNVDI